MARPAKPRIVCGEQEARVFTTGRGAPGIELAPDELETLRLLHLEELDQAAAAGRMGISRGTLQRMLRAASRKLTFALVNGCSISVSGDTGNFRHGCPAGTRCRFCRCKLTSKRIAGAEKMRIAVASEHEQVFQHFGHTPEFTIFDVDEKRITAERIEPAGAAGHGALAGFLADRGVGILICGGIGGGAQMALAEAGIRLVAGVRGGVRPAVEAYLNGTLVTDPDFSCGGHHDGGHRCGGHEHSCGGHHDGGHEHSCGGHHDGGHGCGGRRG